jgi:tRNA 2-thiocytidine biosynthesis protein TtcA
LESLQGKHIDRIRKLAGECIGRFGLIRENDRILAGLSGGKDSFILLHVLHYFQKVAPVKFEIIAGTFDPGYPEFNLQKIAEYCQLHNWQHKSVAVNMAELLEEKGLDGSPCGLCSRLRRGKLYGLASELKCNKLALGQHLDDLIASFFMSLCRGQGIKTMAPLAVPQNKLHPTVIRPLALVPEELLKETALCNDFPAAGTCRYEELLESGDRRYFRELADTLTARIPDFRSNFIRSLGHIEPEHLMITPALLKK